jgi:hypothetical protein
MLIVGEAVEADPAFARAHTIPISDGMIVA